MEFPMFSICKKNQSYVNSRIFNSESTFRLMKYFIIFYIMLLPFRLIAKEWKCLKSYQKETQHTELSPSDWLKSDRKNNTEVWRNANSYNLTYNKAEAYTTFDQRKDFFAWIDAELSNKGHEVVWPSMAYFINNKLRLLETFPYKLMTHRSMKAYANAGSDAVFINSFETLKRLYNSETILKDEMAVAWDKNILHEEQFVWIQSVYETMDDRSIARVEKIAKGKSIYGLFVPKVIRFEGGISCTEDRYNYALEKLRSYCLSLKK